MPADEAVILHPEANYVALELPDGHVEIVAEALAEKAAAKFGYTDWKLAQDAEGNTWKKTGVELPAMSTSSQSLVTLVTLVNLSMQSTLPLTTVLVLFTLHLVMA